MRAFSGPTISCNTSMMPAAVNHGFAVIEHKCRHLAHRAVAANLFFIDIGVEIEMLERNSEQLHRDGSRRVNPEIQGPTSFIGLSMLAVGAQSLRTVL